MTCREQLAADETFDPTRDDALEHMLGIGYHDGVTADVYAVLEKTKDASSWWIKIAEDLDLSQNYVHLILELLCNAELTECGTSPRRSWINDRGEEILEMRRVK